MEIVTEEKEKFANDLNDLLTEVRNWDSEWNKYIKTRSVIKPKTSDEFVEELLTKYIITKL